MMVQEETSGQAYSATAGLPFSIGSGTAEGDTHQNSISIPSYAARIPRSAPHAVSWLWVIPPLWLK